MGSRVLVVGGDAAGMSAAAELRRRLPESDEVVVLERTDRTSYSACGIPYWVAGDVESIDALVARSPEEHRARGIDLRTGTEAVAIDLDAREVRTEDDAFGWDRLVIATGAEPVRPDLPGIEADGILGVQTLSDGQEVIDALEDVEHVVVVGSGYVGLEMAEACTRRGLRTTVVERSSMPLSMLEPTLGAKVADAMRGMDITLRTDTEVTGFTSADGRVTGVEIFDGTTLPAEVVILGLGVTARSGMAADAGMPTGPKGGIVVDATQRVQGVEDVWAAGDCVATLDRITGELVHVPLGTHANKQGVVVADAIAADLLGEKPRLAFPGIVQTAITKFCSLEVSRTGLSEREARAAGFDPVVVTIDTTTIAGYFPKAGDMTVLMMADRPSRRLLGVQIVGDRNAGLRVDAAAVALTAEMTVDDVVMLDLAYAPPFASVWSPVQVAARTLVKSLS